MIALLRCNTRAAHRRLLNVATAGLSSSARPTRLLCLASEVHANRKLDLPAGAEADGAADGTRQAAEGAGGRGRVGLAGLQAVGFGERGGRQRGGQRADRVREIDRVEEVE